MNFPKCYWKVLNTCSTKIKLESTLIFFHNYTLIINDILDMINREKREKVEIVELL